MRIGNLRYILAYLYLGDYFSVLILHGYKLINSAEHRCTAGSNKSLAHSENINLGALYHQITDKMLVKRI